MSNTPNNNHTKTIKAISPTNQPLPTSQVSDTMPEKLYFSIGEVAKMLEVKPSVLRFWETEFPAIHPHKNKKGTRQYTAHDITLLKHIYHLTRHCGYTLDGVREQLRLDGIDNEKMQIAQTLMEAKHFLQELKKQL